MSNNQKHMIVTIIIFAIIILTIFLCITIQHSITNPSMNTQYQTVSFKSEQEMLDTINGSWGFYQNYKFLGDYINFNDYICTFWSADLSPEYKEITLDYKNGKIIFDNSYYYDVVIYKDEMYIRISPNAQKEEYYFLYKKCTEPIPN